MIKRTILEKLIDLFFPQIRAAFLAAIQDVVDSVLLLQVTRAIQEGDPIKAFQVLGMSPAALRLIVTSIEAAYEKAHEKGCGPAIDDGALQFDLESAYEYLTTGDLP